MAKRNLLRLYELIREARAFAAVATVSKAEPLSAAELAVIEELKMHLLNAESRIGDFCRPVASPAKTVKTTVEVKSIETRKPASPPVTTAHKPVVKPRSEWVSTHRQLSLASKFTKAQITEILGVNPERGDPDKTTSEWNFYVDGKACAIWDYKGAKWSAYGPRECFEALGLTVVGK